MGVSLKRVGMGVATGGLSEVPRSLGSLGGSLGGMLGGLGGMFDVGARNKALDEAAAMLDPGPKPAEVIWKTLLDESTGRLNKKYELGAAGTAYGKILDKYRTDAFRDPSEKSPEQLIMEERLGLQQNQQLQDATTQGARQAAEARASLAGKGGLSSAAMQRLAKSQSRDVNRSMQQIRSSGADRMLGIQEQELANRRDIFNRLAGIEGDVETKNIQGSLTEIGAGRQNEQKNYEEQMKAWAAGRQGQATILAGKGSKK